MPVCIHTIVTSDNILSIFLVQIILDLLSVSFE